MSKVMITDNTKMIIKMITLEDMLNERQVNMYYHIFGITYSSCN